MNTTNRMTNEHALNIALTYAGIENTEPRCLSNSYRNGFYHITVWTPYLKYEFYVDALTGEVAGIDTEPVPYQEALHFAACGEESFIAA